MTSPSGGIARSMKWLIAAVLFVLALTVTFSEVYGNPTDRSANREVNGNTSRYPDAKPSTDGPSGSIDGPQDNPPATVPEPATLILLGSGLGVMYAMRKRLRK